METYGEDYFERGVESGKSLYSNYCWMPELTIPMAYQVIRILGLNEGHKVLDFGCAKGYLVKALRLLHVDAYGVDCSEYAIQSSDASVREYLACTINSAPNYRTVPNCFKSRWQINEWDAIIAKDVLEHLSYDELDVCLEWFSEYAGKVLVVVPLGDGEKYCIPSYELDPTHVIRQPLDWWREKMEKYWWTSATYSLNHLKENWEATRQSGNGFLVGKRK